MQFTHEGDTYKWVEADGRYRLYIKVSSETFGEWIPAVGVPLGAVRKAFDAIWEEDDE